MNKKLLIIGAGGHARSVMDIIIQNNEYEIAGCIDNLYGKQQFVEGMDGIEIIGNDEMFEEFFNKGYRKVFIAIGENRLRNKIFDKVVDIGFEPVNVISKNAFISEKAVLKKGICVMAGAVINANVKIDDNCIINTNCSIDHDCIIGKSVHIAPGVAMSGTVVVGKLTQIGTGAVVIDNIVIGENTFVGGGGLSSIISKTMLLFLVILQRLSALIKLTFSILKKQYLFGSRNYFSSQ
ncbi:acetyltransferase [Lachnospiraceae bacterium NSJ-143]|nr:acetyltransferase [Lachnospiraceae bacterium NSJ-143]